MKPKLLAFAIAALLGTPALAAPAPGELPSGGSVAAGQASISSAGNAMTINQASNKAILNWNSFNIGEQASLHFNQPSSSAVALNRVNSANPSQIYGSLSANGQVFLVNTAGVYFGPNSRVDVGGLVASTQNISDRNFLDGNYTFDAPAVQGEGTRIDNQGKIRTTDGGYIAFIAPQISNSGSLEANGGMVAMAAGNKVSLDFSGDSLINFSIDEGAFNAEVNNGGVIRAHDGTVKLSARMADELTKAVVNNSGIIEANSIAQQGGRILIGGGAGTQTTISGKLDASSQSAKGGHVEITGEQIELTETSQIDATGATGGGNVLVGGDWQGGASEQHRVYDDPDAVYEATQVTMRAGATINATALENGNGGTVVLWSDIRNPDSITSAHGSITARGGTQGGNGGKIETSGRVLQVDGIKVSTRAAQGAAGIWLLDPGDITISAGSVGGNTTTINPDTINSSLEDTNVIVQTAGGISVDAGIATTQTATGGLTLDATAGSVDVRSDISLGTGRLTLKATQDVVIQNDRTITTQGGDIVLWANSDNINNGYIGTGYQVTLQTNGGAIYMGGGSDGGNTGALSSAVALDGLPDMPTAGYGGPAFGIHLGNGGIGTAFSIKLLSGGGDITLLGGIAGDYSSGQNAHGIGIVPGYTIDAGSGNITMKGYANSAGGNSYGLDLMTGGQNVSSSIASTGNVTLYGETTANSAESWGVAMGGGGALAINATSIDIAANGADRDLHLDAQLTATDTITVTGSASNPQGIVGTANSAITAPNLLVKDATTVNLSAGTNNVDTLAATGLGAFTYIDQDDLTIGSVNGVDGITYSGGNTMTIQADAISGSGNINFGANGGSLVLNATAGLGTYSGVISGSGLLTKSGAGTLVLTGNNTYTGNYVGATFIYGGTLQIGDGSSNATSGTVGAGNIIVQSGANLTYARSDDLTMSQVISGGGSLIKDNTGTLVLTQNNTYTGGTTINDGVLVLRHDAPNPTVKTFDGSGALRIEPSSTSFTSPFSTSGWTFNSTLSDLTLGKYGNTANITMASDQTVSGPVTIYGGAIAINGALTATSSNINLHATGAVTQTAAMTADSLNLSGAGSFTLTNTGNTIGTLAGGDGTNKLGSLSFVNSGALIIGTVDSTGISASGDLSISTLTGDLTVADDVTTDSTSASAITLNAGFSESAGTATGGDILLSANVAAGTNGRIRLFTGSVAGSTGITDAVGFGSGNFRYNADETTNFSTGSWTNIGNSGTYAIYREQPTANITDDMMLSMTYGDTLPEVSGTGMVNGDVSLYNITGRADSASGNIQASGTPYAISSNLAGLGYNVTGNSSGTLTVNAKALNISGLLASNKTYDGLLTASLTGTETLSSGSANSSDGLYIIGDTVSLSGSATGEFADKNVGENITVTVAGLSLSGADAVNYVLNDYELAADITAKTVTLSASKAYDGTTDLTGYVTLGDFVGLETLVYSGATASSKHVTTPGKYINAINLGDGDNGGLASNYQLPDLTAYSVGVNSVTINAATLTTTLSNTGVTKVYDGTTNAPGDFVPTGSFTGLIAGDTAASLNFTAASYNDANVLAANTLAVSGLNIGSVIGSNGSLASDYVLDSTSKSVVATISKVTLTVQADNDAKFVTQSDTVNFAGVSYSGFVNGETTSVLGGTATVTRSNAGMEVAGIYSSVLQASGLTADNYAFNYVNGDFTIVPSSQLLVRVTDVSNTYGTTTSYGITSASYWDGSQEVVLGAPTNIGNNTFAANDGAGGSAVFTLAPSNPNTSGAGFLKTGSYQLDITGTVTENSGNFSDTITVVGSHQVNSKALSASATAGISKIYDGTTAMNGISLALTGKEVNDTVTVAGLGAFDSRNADSNLGYTINNIALSGADADNYYLSGGGSFSGNDGEIIQKTISLDPQSVSRGYNGSASQTTSAADLEYLTSLLGVSGDSVISATLDFDDKNVGNGKTLTLSTAMIEDGNGGNNYAITFGSNNTSEITPKSLTISGITASNKIYDGNVAAAVNTGSVAFNGMINGDDLSISTTGAFDDKNVGDGKTVTLTSSYGGADAGNYTFTDQANTIANITPKALTVSGITADNKVYDGNVAAAVNTGSVAFNGMINGDDLGTSTTGAFDDKNVGDGKTVTLTSSYGGADAGNYTFTDQANTIANITPKSLTISGITASNKVYDGNVAAAVNTGSVAFNGMINGDDLGISTTGAFDDKNVGDGKTVTLTSSYGGADAGNYTFTDQANTIANITPKALAVSGITASNKVYDGNVAAAVNTGSVAFNGMINGDDLGISTTGAFDDKNVGDGKTVTLTSSYGGVDAGNYAFTDQTNTTANITRLDSVTWVGGATGNWFDPANWAGGAVPDLANVANVVIPSGVIIDFNNTVVLPAEAGTVNIDSIGTGGGLNVSAGELNVANDLQLANYTQSGGDVSTGGDFTITDSFDQTGGSITVAGNVDISQTSGNTNLDNISVGGTLDVTADGDITQQPGSTITVTGETTLASTNGDITLDSATNDFSMVNASGDNISLSDANSIGLGDIDASGLLTVTAADDITLDGTIEVASLDLTATNGDITQNGGPLTVTTGPTDLRAGGDITLDQANDFNGAVNVANAQNVTLNDINSIELGDIDASGLLTVTAVDDITLDGAIEVASLDLTATNGDITQNGGTLTVTTGPTDLSAGGNITLDQANDFIGAVNVANAQNVTLNDINSIELGDIDATGQLTVMAADNITLNGTIDSASLNLTATGGDITQNGGTLTVTAGPTDLGAGGDIALNQANDFNGTVSASGGNIALADANGIELGNVTAGGTLEVTAQDGITQQPSSTIAVSGEATLASANGDITLDSPSNDFGVIHASGGNITLSDANAIELGNISASGSLDVSAQDDITQQPGSTITVSGETALTSANGTVSISESGNSFGNGLTIDDVNSELPAPTPNDPSPVFDIPPFVPMLLESSDSSLAPPVEPIINCFQGTQLNQCR